MKTHDIIKLGLVQIPEGRKLWPYMSVLSNLRLGAYLQKNRAVINQQLDEVFERFPRLKERRNQQAGTLSGVLAIDNSVQVVKELKVRR